MQGAIVIADEITAAGLRLAGAETLVPEAGEVAAAFEDARGRAALVVLTAEFARRVPRARLEAALLGERPIVTVIGDIEGRSLAPDLLAQLRSVLGAGA